MEADKIPVAGDVAGARKVINAAIRVLVPEPALNVRLRSPILRASWPIAKDWAKW